MRNFSGSSQNTSSLCEKDTVNDMLRGGFQISLPSWPAILELIVGRRYRRSRLRRLVGPMGQARWTRIQASVKEAAKGHDFNGN